MAKNYDGRRPLNYKDLMYEFVMEMIDKIDEGAISLASFTKNKVIGNCIYEVICNDLIDDF